MNTKTLAVSVVFSLLIVPLCAQVPTLVKDINPGNVPSNSGLYGIELNGGFVFTAETANNGRELWFTDASTNGTFLIKDIYPGTSSSYPGDMTLINGVIYFTAESNTDGKELWRTDGTTVGTQMVKDIAPGSLSGFSQQCCGTFSLYLAWQHNGYFFFLANQDGYNSNDVELWKSDGSAAGTVRVKDIYPGNNPSYPSYFEIFNNELYFIADDGTNGRELWKTNGDASGTVIVKDIKPGANSGFTQNCCGDFGLYKQWEHNGSFFFVACDYSGTGGDNTELWKTDGTTAGTVRVKDIYPGNMPSYPSYFVAFNNNLYFIANDGSNGRELWKTDGDAAGTLLVKDIKPGSSSGFSQNCCGDFGLYNVWENNGSFFFQACDYSGTGGDNFELWKTDGTTAGTVRLKDIYPGNMPSYPSYFEQFNNNLYFIANDGTNGRELWKTDGNAAGTVMVKDIKPGSSSGFSQNCCGDFGLYNVWENNGSFFFVSCSYSGTGGDDVELWKCDGTTGGTVRVADINAGNAPSYPQEFVPFNNQLFFTAETPTAGRELYKTDGTTGGTVMIKDIYPGTFDGLEYYLNNIIWTGNTFYFTATQLSSSDFELWKTDGTTPGTVKVLDIYPGTNGSYPGYFTLLQNDNLIFLATDPTHENELWTLYLPGVTGLEEQSTQSLFTVFPNPNNGDGINVTIPTSEKSTIVLTDLSGKKILSQTIPAGSENTTTRLIMPEIKSGFYMVFLVDEKNERWVRKIEIFNQ